MASMPRGIIHLDFVDTNSSGVTAPKPVKPTVSKHNAYGQCAALMIVSALTVAAPHVGAHYSIPPADVFASVIAGLTAYLGFINPSLQLSKPKTETPNASVTMIEGSAPLQPYSPEPAEATEAIDLDNAN